MVRKTIAGVLPDEWKGTLIKNICRVVRGSSPRPAGSPLFFDGNFLPWATVADLTNSDDMYLTSTKSMLTEAGAERTRITDPGTLMLTNSGATLGVPKISSIRCGANDGIAMLLELDGIVTEYAYYYLASKTQYFRDVIAPGVGQPNLNTDLIGDFPIPMPPLAEQKKIAQILSTWDKAIATAEKLLANRQQQKKALMQKILTGRDRFSEFTEKWKYHELSDIAMVQMGSSPKSGAYNENGYGLPLIQGNADIKNRRSAPRIFTTEITKECDVGDILLSVRAPVGTVALSSHKACIGRGISAIRATMGFSQDFLYQWFLWFEPRWGALSQGSTFESINSDDIKQLKIKLPSLDEQKKIALILSNADQEIELLQQKLNHLKQEKKALMQHLLTGKRRVKVEAA
ncbi:restriction endonuclease subunit S [Pectobacterium aroidearum]|uniref:restriction endonuclease subunit S n=1 Tax=Pectobacterium aroidearum TaxID=1201031 RepID=UPI002A83F103|nr:restriction endonuclease subunit S [Pectobacterium aroidearum]MDY4387155.1 restriction endonuclease subunit S [Pectobacterium aroidearum]